MTFKVHVKPRAFQAGTDVFALSIGDTVEDAIIDSASRASVDLSMFAFAAVTVDGDPIERSRWPTTKPASGANVYIVAMPGGSIGSLIVNLIGAALLIPTFGLSGWALVGLRVGITIATTLISGAIAPTPRARNSGREDPVLARHTISGTRNQAKPYGTISRPFGRLVNYYPALAAAPYTEIIWGEKQYLRMVFDVGYGPQKISNIKIGNQLITDLEDTEYEVREGRAGDAKFRLAPEQVREETLNIQLKQVDGYHQKTTEPDTDEITFDITFPGGSQRITDRNEKYSLTTQFEVQIKLTTSAVWTVPVVRHESGGVVFLNFVAVTPPIYIPGFTPPGDIYGGSAAQGSEFEITANTKNALYRSVSIKVARGQYDIRLRRNSADNRADNVGKNQSVTVEDTYWTALRSHRHERPFNKSGIARIAVRAKATDQLNGIIDQLNCTVESYLPVWNGSVWTEKISRNPAWVFAEVLRGSANARPLADSRLDLDALMAWADWCDEEGYSFDGAIETRSSVWETLQDITGTACASPSIRDGLYSVVVDNERPFVTQHFTMRNSRNFSAVKAFLPAPHALKVRFPNVLTLHQTDELIVYSDGYSAANATVFEALDLPYTTDATAAWKRARRAYAAAVLRPELYRLTTDIEHIPVTRGDLVRVSTDVTKWSVGSARVASIDSATFPTWVTIDAPLTMTGGVSYVLTFRVSRIIIVDGAPVTTQELVAPVITVAGAQTYFDFTSALTGAAPELPIVGTLCELHVTGKEIYCLVRSVEDANDHEATITLVDYAPAVFTSDSGTIPTFNPQITTVKTVNLPAPPVPSITSIDSDEDVLIRSSSGTLTSRIVLSVLVKRQQGKALAQSIQSRFRPAGTAQQWVNGPTIDAPSGEISLLPVQDLETYSIQLRSVRSNGVTSEWVEITHKVIGKSAVGPRPPPDVERFYRSGNSVTWPYPDPPVDIKGFLIRANYGSSIVWGTARPLHTGVVVASPFSIANLHGTQTILIKAVDLSNNQSLTAAKITINLGDLITSNIVDTISHAPTFPGVLVNGTDTGTQIEANINTVAAFYGLLQAAFYPNAAAPRYPGNYYNSMTYTAHYDPVSNHLNNGILRTKQTVVGDYTIDYRIYMSTAFYGAGGSDFYGPVGSPFYDAPTIGEYTTWPGRLGPFETINETFDLRITTEPGETRGIVSLFDLIIDVDDIVEVFNDQVITVAANGLRLPITKTYRSIDNVSLTLEDDGGAALTLRIIDRNPTTGPLIKAYTTSNAVTTASFDARIKGH